MEEPNDTPHATGETEWKRTMDDLGGRAEKFVRDDPSKAVGLALLGGVLLTILPIGRLLGGLVRLAFALLRPVVMVLGAVKLYEEVEKKRKL